MSESNTQSRPVLSVVLKPNTDLERVRLRNALMEIVQQDHSLRVETESPDGKTVISGAGKAELEKVCKRLADEFEVGIEVGKPEVVYLETIRQQAEAEVMLTGLNKYAHVALRLEPLPAGSGYQFVDATAGVALPAQFVEPVSSGIHKAMKRGLLGNEVVDLRAVLQGGSYHEGISNVFDFETAGAMAFEEVASKAGPVLLEPMMSVEIVVPDDVAGTVIGELSSRRGHIQSLEHVANSHVICTISPLAEILGYADDLRKSTRGESGLSMYFLRYDPAPCDGASGGDEAGVTAKKPSPPKTGCSSAAARY